MKRKTKAIIALLVIAIMTMAFIPFNSFKVFAEGETYAIAFEVKEGEHRLELSGTTDLGIDGQFLSLEKSQTDRTKIGTFTKESDTKYILRVPANESGVLVFNNKNNDTQEGLYSLFIGNSQISAGYAINGNTNIDIKNYVENTNPGGNNPGGGDTTTPYTLTFNVKNGLTGDNYTISSDNNHLIIGGVYIDLVDVSNPQQNIAASVTVGTDGKSATIVSSGSMAGKLDFNTDKFSLYAAGHVIDANTSFNTNTSIQIEEYNTNTHNNNVNATSTINYQVSGPIEYREFNGYDETGVAFSINDTTYRMNSSKATYTEEDAYERDEFGEIILDDNNNPIPIRVPGPNGELEQLKERTGVTVTGDTITYSKDTNDTTVAFKFYTSWNTKITSITINGEPVSPLPSTRDQLIACYKNHCLEIEAPDVTYAATYNIVVQARKQNDNEIIMGNFLWDYNEQGYTEPEDKILNGTLTLIQAEYDGEVYDTPEEINALGGVYEWNNVVRKNVYRDDREGVGTATFPVGTKLTVKIIPDAGYQLINFGVNGGVFDAEDEVGTYTFEIKGGNFHLQARIAQVDDVVKSVSDKVESGSIALGGDEESMSIGTARLDVKDIDLTEEEISNFEEAAGDYEIKDYLDISLFNTVFKGTEDDSWDTQVKDLDNEATITLKLEDGVDGNEVVIVHEKHDGTYEIIPVEYDADTNTITFKTASFSNYAIASKTSDTATTSDSNKTVNTPKTGDNIMIFASIFVIAVVAYVITIKKRKNIKISRKH